MPRASRSVSRGRKATAKVKLPKSAKSKKATYEMDYEEGDQVMARWPGTALYFKAKVTYVREDDNEYDVQYEDGTVFTIKSKEVKSQKNVTALTKKKTPSRSRSRGRSQGRSTAKSPARNTSSKRASRKPVVIDPTPTRISARIAAAKIELSEDEDCKIKKRFPELTVQCSPTDLHYTSNFGWIKALFFMVLGPLIVLSLHNLCNNKTCKIGIPNLSHNWKDYYNSRALFHVVGFSVIFKLLSFLISRVRALSGREGFLVLVALLAAIPALVYRKISLRIVEQNYYHYMTSSILLAFISALGAFIISRLQLNRKSHIIVDFVAGCKFNPSMFGFNFKLLTFRYSMCCLAILNIALVIASIEGKNGAVNSTVVLTAAFQVLYAADALFFEDYYFFSYDAMNSGYGFTFISSYAMFPFVPTLITRYVIATNPVLPMLQLFSIGLVNAAGYIIFRTSETQRCEFAKSPNSASSKKMNSINVTKDKRILCSGWWSVIRHPNYLGEILIQWSWVLTAVSTAGTKNLLIYYLPVFTTLMLLVRCCHQNNKNKRKYGAAWNTYCEKVKKNLIPFIY